LRASPHRSPPAGTWTRIDGVGLAAAGWGSRGRGSKPVSPTGKTTSDLRRRRRRIRPQFELFGAEHDLASRTRWFKWLGGEGGGAVTCADGAGRQAWTRRLSPNGASKIPAGSRWASEFGWAPCAVREHRPADVVARPLVVEKEPDRFGGQVTLPLALQSPSDLAFGCNGSCGLDRIGGRPNSWAATCATAAARGTGRRVASPTAHCTEVGD